MRGSVLTLTPRARAAPGGAPDGGPLYWVKGHSAVDGSMVVAHATGRTPSFVLIGHAASLTPY